MALLGMICMVRNEERLIAEFLAHHLGLGVERIHVLDNGSTDATRARIEAARRAVPSITVESWAGDHKSAFLRGVSVLRDEVEWLLAIDCDEFVVSAEGDNLPGWLARQEGHAAIGLHWAIYGSSGLEQSPADLYTASFLRRAADDFGPNRHIKSLVRPRYVQGVWNSHAFSLDATRFPYVNVMGERLEWAGPQGFGSRTPLLSPFRVNHYFCRDRAFWNAKMRRAEEASRRIRNTQRTEQDWIRHDRNEIEDLSALRHVPATRALLARMGFDARGSRLGVVARRERAGRSEWIRARAMTLRAAAARATGADAAILDREARSWLAWAQARG